MSGRNSRGSQSYRQQNHGPRRDPNRPIELFIRQPYFGMIVRGEKTIEGRVAYRSLDRAQEGLPLHFKQGLPGSPIARTLIDWTLRADTFEDALLEVRWQDAIPNVGKFDDALAIYDRIYPPAKVQEIGGVVLLGFTLQDVVRGNA